jgi:glutathione S-transferase
MVDPVLWQFKYSHYNEKVRWALDYKQIPHLRRSLLPGPHVPRVWWMTGQKAVPVLVLDGKAIADSTRIIEALEGWRPDPALYPGSDEARARALALEEFFDEELGPHLRRTWFYEVMPDADFTVAQIAVGWGPTTQRIYRACYPVVSAVMRADMRIDAVGAALGRDKVQAALDRISAELQPSGYLVGERFSVADLTAAALLSPVLMPAEFPYPLLTQLPESAARYRAALATHPAFEWAAGIYRTHRGRSMERPAVGGESPS